MAEEREGEGFTVVDKRGRQDAPAEERAVLLPPSAQVEGPRKAPASGPAPPLGLDLTPLFLMLANSALVHLGEAPDPMTGATQRDLAQARLSIELLRLLRAKTEGHRSGEESRLLEEILYSLQMHFVEATGRPSRPG